MYTYTLLHGDVADAINFPVHMEGRGEESEWWKRDENPHALWTLWRREDVEELRKYLREYFNIGPNVDPIHLGDLQITPDMFEAFKARGIEPYVFRQRVGQAVIIPALTPHYVSRYTEHSHVKLISLLLRSLI